MRIRLCAKLNVCACESTDLRVRHESNVNQRGAINFSSAFVEPYFVLNLIKILLTSHGPGGLLKKYLFKVNTCSVLWIWKLHVPRVIRLNHGTPALIIFFSPIFFSLEHHRGLIESETPEAYGICMISWSTYHAVGVLYRRVRDLSWAFPFQYFLQLLVVFIIMLAGGVVGYVFRGDVDKSVYKAMWESIPLYNNDTAVTHAWDEIQKNVSARWQASNDSPLSLSRIRALSGSTRLFVLWRNRDPRYCGVCVSRQESSW